jgi:hypothetical protein
MLLTVHFFGMLGQGINMEKLRSNFMSRIIRCFTTSLGMTFAWLMKLTIHLCVGGFLDEGLQLRLLSALGASVATFISVLMLDGMSDWSCTGPATDKAIILVILCLGTFVGLTWEHAFEKCAELTVEIMAIDESNPLFRLSSDSKVWALVLCACIQITVLPAYRNHIVPRMYHMIESHQNDLLEKESEFRRQKLGSVGEHQMGEYGMTEGVFFWQGDSQIEMCTTDTSPEMTAAQMEGQGYGLPGRGY